MYISGLEQETCLRTCHHFVFPADRGEDNTAYAATIAANLVSVGFAMTADDVKRLAKCGKDDLIRFYQDIYPVIELQDAYNYHPFYPGFPQEVMEKDRIEIFLDQLLYAVSGFELTPDKMEETKAAFPFMGEASVYPVQGMSEDEYNDEMRLIMGSSLPYRPDHIAMLQVFAMRHPQTAVSIAPPVSELKQRENRIILGCILEDRAEDRSVLRGYLQTPADVLRYAAVRSAMNDYRSRSGGGEMPDIGLYSDAAYNSIYQKASLQYDNDGMPSFHLSRSARKFCMLLLEEMFGGDAQKLAAGMMRHKKEWKRLFTVLHYSEMKKNGTVTLAKASEMIRNNVSVDRYDRRIEQAVQRKDLDAILMETPSNPGDFIRRFDKILRIGMECGQTDRVLARLKDCVRSSRTNGISASTSLISHISARSHREYSRSFTIEKTGKVWNTEKKNREPLPADICAAVKDACMEGISEKFRGKGNMGNVYISPEMKNCKVPTGTRTMNEGTNVNTFGSVVPVDLTKDTLRLFVGWSNETISQSSMEWDDEIDIDLTADVITREGKVLHCGWNGNYSLSLDEEEQRGAVVYSGDVRTGNPGEKAEDCGCEYIDINPAVLKDSGAQYVICGISLYTGADSFRDMKHLDFGYMLRDSSNHGKLFDTRTVQTKQAVRNDSTICVPIIYDVQNDRIIYVNKSVSKNSRAVTDEMQNLINLLPVVQVQTDNGMTLEELILVNAKSNGAVTDDPAQADILYMTRKELADFDRDENARRKDGAKIYCQDDYAHIIGVLLKSPVPGTDLFHPVQSGREERVCAAECQPAQETDASGR